MPREVLSRTKIPYLTHVCNCAVGCFHGCPHCFARERWAPRMRGRCELCARYVPHLHPERLNAVTPRQKPKRIGVGFFADLFGDWRWHTVPFYSAVYSGGEAGVTTEGLARALSNKFRDCPQHRFVTATQRPENIPAELDPPDNWWLLVTVLNGEHAAERIAQALASPFKHVGISYEPATGPIDWQEQWLHPQLTDEEGMRWEDGDADRASVWTKTKGLEWGIAGGMSGPKATPSHPDWFRDMRDRFEAARVAYYFKQWGEYAPVPFSSAWDDRDVLVERDGSWRPWTDDWCEGDMKMRRFGKKVAGYLLDADEWRQMPSGLLLPGENER